MGMHPGVVYEAPYVCIETRFSKRPEDDTSVVWVCKRCSFLDQEDCIQNEVFETRGEVLLHLHKHQKQMHDHIGMIMAKVADEIQRKGDSW
jgi:hypothetical protein